MISIKSLEKHPAYKGFSLLKNLAGLLGVIWTVLVWMNLVPGYEFRRTRSDLVEPQVYLFPAQRIRLSPSFVDGTQNNRVTWAKWALSKYGVERYTSDGLQPTVTIPEAEGGIYQLEVKLKLSDESRERHGSTNVYVVQDEPLKAKTSVKTSFSIDQSNTSGELEALAQRHGFEIYQGKEGWKAVDNAMVGSSAITLPRDTELSSFGGKVIFRAKGSAQKDLSSYGTFSVPAAFVGDKEERKVEPEGQK